METQSVDVARDGHGDLKTKFIRVPLHHLKLRLVDGTDRDLSPKDPPNACSSHRFVVDWPGAYENLHVKKVILPTLDYTTNTELYAIVEIYEVIGLAAHNALDDKYLVGQ